MNRVHATASEHPRRRLTGWPKRVANGTKGWKASVEKQRGVHVPFVVYAPGQSQFVQGKQDIISDLSDLLLTLAEIMGTTLPPQDEYELSGNSLWPYLTKQTNQHREWIYGYKGNRQMVRGHHLLRDGMESSLITNGRSDAGSVLEISIELARDANGG